MLKAYPRHSVDITWRDYKRIFAFIFASHFEKEGLLPEFERRFAEYIGTRFALSMPSARLGLYAILQYFNFPEGTEVIITPFTHQSIFTVLKTFRLKPVFVDIDERTHNTNPQLVKKLISKKTRLLILTHMWGQPCDMDAFTKIKNAYDLKVIEDCAMATGATYKGQKVGSFSDASIFSFGKAKAICTFGGGMLCFNDPKMKDFVSAMIQDFHAPRAVPLAISVINSMIANILTRPRFFFLTLYPVMRFLNLRDPYNPVEHKKDSEVILEHMPEEWKVRLSSFQAALGLEQLKTLDERNQDRARNAQLLNALLEGTPGIGLPVPHPDVGHIYLYYAVHIQRPLSLDQLRARLLKRSVDTQLNELTNPQQLRVFGADSRDFPAFERISSNLLVIPNGIYLNARDIRVVAAALKQTLLSMGGGDKT